MGRLSNAAWILAASPVVMLASETATAANQTIDEFEAAQQTAWNAHNGAAYAAAFDQNASVITSLGWRWTGQAEAAQNISDSFKFVYAQAHLRLSDVQVRVLTPELTSVTLRWSMIGARPIGAGSQVGEQEGFETQLLQRRGENWVILAQQDTARAAPVPASSHAPQRAMAPASTFPTTPPPVRRCVLARANGQCLISGKAKPSPTN